MPDTYLSDFLFGRHIAETVPLVVDKSNESTIRTGVLNSIKYIEDYLTFLELGSNTIARKMLLN